MSKFDKRKRINLFNGDSFEVLKDIPDNSIDLVVIDPPYLFQDNGGGGAFGYKKKGYHTELENIKDGFDFTLLDSLERVMKKTNIYIFANKDLLFNLITHYKEKKKNLDLLTWTKTNPVPACGNKYLSDTEYILFVREKGVKVYGEYKTKRKNYTSPLNIKDKNLYGHPTCKPVELLEKFIFNSSKEGEVVLDCFMGSGSTGVACKNLKRKFVGIELDKEYFKICKSRIKKAS